MRHRVDLRCSVRVPEGRGWAFLIARALAAELVAAGPAGRGAGRLDDAGRRRPRLRAALPGRLHVQHRHRLVPDRGRLERQR